MINSSNSNKSQISTHNLNQKPQIVKIVRPKKAILPPLTTGAILIPSKAGNSASNFKVFQKIVRQPTGTTSNFSKPMQLNAGLSGQLSSGSIEGLQHKIIARNPNPITEPTEKHDHVEESNCETRNYEEPDHEELKNSIDPETVDDDDPFRYVTVLFTKLNEAKWKIFNRYNFYSLIL